MTSYEARRRACPPTDRWAALWNRMSMEERHALADLLHTSYNVLRAYANGTKRMGPDRAREAATHLNAMGYAKVNKAWFRPDLWG